LVSAIGVDSFRQQVDAEWQQVRESELIQIILLKLGVFADGSAFSQARLLRDRYAFRADIRAEGGVLCDQLWFMKRNGFNQFQLAEGESIELAFRIFGDIYLTFRTELKQSIAR